MKILLSSITDCSRLYPVRCNNDGKCQSEFLRDMIETLCEDCSNKELESKMEEKEPEIVTTKPTIVAHGKILDDYGNVIGTF